jgi:hypothetical protein
MLKVGGLLHMHCEDVLHMHTQDGLNALQRTPVRIHEFGNSGSGRTNLSHEQGKIDREAEGVVEHECMGARELQLRESAIYAALES